MVNVIRTCDICGKDYVRINVKYKVKGLRKDFGLRNWCDADISDYCINEIRKTIREKWESERNANSN